MFQTSVLLLCCSYTGISEVQSFSIDTWSSAKLRSSDYLLPSHKLKIVNALWLSSKYRLNGVFQLKPDSLDVGKKVHTFWPKAIALLWHQHVHLLQLFYRHLHVPGGKSAVAGSRNLAWWQLISSHSTHCLKNFVSTTRACLHPILPGSHHSSHG